MKIYGLALVTITALFVVACSGDKKSQVDFKTEIDIKAEFNEAVETANWCEIGADCAYINPGCPLGCNVAVNSENADELYSLASELIDEYEAGGVGCQYQCMAPAPPVCEENRCARSEG